jgi:hypothetical protein
VPWREIPGTDQAGWWIGQERPIRLGLFAAPGFSLPGHRLDRFGTCGRWNESLSRRASPPVAMLERW